MKKNYFSYYYFPLYAYHKYRRITVQLIFLKLVTTLKINKQLSLQILTLQIYYAPHREQLMFGMLYRKLI